MEQKCKPGYRWCPISKKCIPDTDNKGKGQRMSRGQGQGPIGTPYKQASEMVDMLLDKSFKAISEVDRILDKIQINVLENELDNVPDQDIVALKQSLEDELSKDSLEKQEEELNDIEAAEAEEEEPQLEESIKNTVTLLITENEYREYFKSMLKKWNIKSPAELDKEKKKEFFDAISKGWKAKKESA